jgi:hypothetical protein
VVKDIDDNLYETIRRLAADDRRSISQEVAYILKKYLSLSETFERNPTDAYFPPVGRITGGYIKSLYFTRSSYRRRCIVLTLVLLPLLQLLAPAAVLPLRLRTAFTEPRRQQPSCGGKYFGEGLRKDKR